MRLNRAVPAIMALLMLLGCSSTITKPDPVSWKLPHKDSADSGMIIGRLDMPSSKKDNPEGLTLLLGNVKFFDLGRTFHHGSDLPQPDIMANNYFVLTNVKPGKYMMVGFFAGVEHNLYGEEGFTFDVKPGQVKFIGSYDYLEQDSTLLQKLRKTGSFGLRKAQHPTELEMFQWLNSVGSGSGWEPAIKRRIQELSGQS